MDNKRELSLTVKDLVGWIASNRPSEDCDAFSEWSLETQDGKDNLAVHLANAETTYIVSGDSSGLTGVCVYETNELYKVLHVNEILSVNRESIGIFAREFRRLFNGWDIQARRKGNIVRYKNTKRLIHMLMKKGGI